MTLPAKMVTQFSSAPRLYLCQDNYLFVYDPCLLVNQSLPALDYTAAIQGTDPVLFGLFLHYDTCLSPAGLNIWFPRARLDLKDFINITTIVVNKCI